MEINNNNNSRNNRLDTNINVLFLGILQAFYLLPVKISTSSRYCLPPLVSCNVLNFKSKQLIVNLANPSPPAPTSFPFVTVIAWPRRPFCKLKNAKNWQSRYPRYWTELNILWTYPERCSRYVQWTYPELHWTYSEHTLNISWTYTEYTLNILWT